jgi:hypothetical protein
MAHLKVCPLKEKSCGSIPCKKEVVVAYQNAYPRKTSCDGKLEGVPHAKRNCYGYLKVCPFKIGAHRVFRGLLSCLSA